MWKRTFMLCIQQKLKSVCAVAQTDLSVKFSLFYLPRVLVDRFEKRRFEETAWMHRLIRVFSVISSRNVPVHSRQSAVVSSSFAC